MTEQFLEQNCVPHEIAKSLKEIGFNEECVAFYGRKGDLKEFAYYDSDNKNSELSNDHLYYSGCIGMEKKMQDCTAPLFQQVFDWFDTKSIFGSPEIQEFDSKERKFSYQIDYLADSGNTHIVYIPSHNEGSDSRKEAQIACIKKMIEIYKEQNK